MYVCSCQKMFVHFLSCILFFPSSVSGFSGGRGVPVQITRRAIGAGRAFVHVAQPVPVAKCPCNNIKTIVTTEADWGLSQLKHTRCKIFILHVEIVCVNIIHVVPL